MKKIFLVVLTLSLSMLYVTYSGAETVSCGYSDLSIKGGNSAKLCGKIDKDGLLTINEEVLSRIYPDSEGLGCVYIYDTKEINGWYVVNTKNGKGRYIAFWTDNDCAPFSEGVNVGLSNGKVVFFDKNIDIVKRANYVYAHSFYKGYSKVCLGDLVEKWNPSTEHHSYYGGLCGYIDAKFNIVVPLNYVFENTPGPFSWNKHIEN